MNRSVLIIFGIVDETVSQFITRPLEIGPKIWSQINLCWYATEDRFIN